MANPHSLSYAAPRSPLRAAAIARALDLPPDSVKVFARLGSTNELAARAVEEGSLQAPALITTSLQTAGRGQHTNTWWSDGGSLCATFALPVDPAMPIGQVPLRAGLAVAEVVARYLPNIRVQVKWPNDVFVDGRKIAGLLCLRRRDTDLIGIGLNIATDLRRAPREVRERATSIDRHTRRHLLREEVVIDLWQAVAAIRTRTDWRESFERLHMLDGKKVEVTGCGENPVCGIVYGVDDEGRLIIEAHGSIVALTQGSPRLNLSA